MERFVLDGKPGWYHAQSDTFFPDGTLESGFVDGVPGMYHRKSDSFYPTGARPVAADAETPLESYAEPQRERSTAPEELLPLESYGEDIKEKKKYQFKKDKAGVAGMTVAAMGRGVEGGQILLADIGEFLTTDPSIPKTEEELKARRDWYMDKAKASSDPDVKATFVKTAQALERNYEKQKSIRGDFESWRKSAQDAFKMWHEERYAPEGLFEQILYGAIEFIPEAPIYEFVGGPAAKYVEAVLAEVSVKLGPKVAEMMARSLPAALKKMGKIIGTEGMEKAGAYATETATHAAAEATAAGATHVVAGHDPETIGEKMVEFAAASTIFKVFKDSLKGFYKVATKRAPDELSGPPKEVEVEDGFSDVRIKLREQGKSEAEIEAQIKQIKQDEIDVKKLHEGVPGEKDLYDTPTPWEVLRQREGLKQEELDPEGRKPPWEPGIKREEVAEKDLSGETQDFQFALDQAAADKAAGKKTKWIDDKMDPRDFEPIPEAPKNMMEFEKSEIDGILEDAASAYHKGDIIGWSELATEAQLRKQEWEKKWGLDKAKQTLEFPTAEEYANWKKESEIMEKTAREEEALLPTEPMNDNKQLVHVSETPVYPFFEHIWRHLEKKSMAEGGGGELREFFLTTRKLKKELDNFLDIDGVRNHRLLGVDNEAFDHAVSGQISEPITADMVVQLMGPLYKDEVAKKLFWSFLTKDRIVSIHEMDKKWLKEIKNRLEEIKQESIRAEEEMLFAERDFEHAKGDTYREARIRRDAAYKNLERLQDEQFKLENLRRNQERIIEEQLDAHPIDSYKYEIEHALDEDALKLISRDYDHPRDLAGMPARQKKFFKRKMQDMTLPTMDTLAKLGDPNAHPLEISPEQAGAAKNLVYENIIAPIRNKVEPMKVDYILTNLKQHIARAKEVLNPYFDNLYRERNGIPKDAKIDEHGQYGWKTGVNVRLIHNMAPAPGKLSKAPTEYIGRQGKSSIDDTSLDLRATGTGQYTTNMEKALNESIKNSLGWATKEKYYKALESKGAVTRTGDYKTKPDIPLEEGVHWVRLDEQGNPIKRPVYRNGKTELHDTYMWIRSDLVEEARGVLGTDARLKNNPLLSTLTAIQLKQLADFVVHGKNLLSEVARAQGKGSKKADIITRIPLLQQLDAGRRIAKVYREVMADSPKIREEIRELAELGVLRKEHGKDDIIATSHILWKIDTASRVLLNRFYKQLLKEGRADAGRSAQRLFINQVGMYQERVMGRFMKMMRQVGLSPFVVAGRRFNKQAFRHWTGESGATKDQSKDEFSRMANLGGMMMMATIPMMVNYYTTGSVLGRPGTPLFGIDLGGEPDEKGKFTVIDIGQWTGHGRAMRLLGMTDVYDGLRGGQTPDQFLSKGLETAVRARTHPFLGPGYQAVEKLGREILDPGTSGTWDVVREVAAELNPVGEIIGLPKYGPIEKKLMGPDLDSTPLSVAGRVLDKLFASPMGAGGVKEKRRPLSGMEQEVINLRGRWVKERGEEGLKMHHTRLQADAAYQKDGAKGMLAVIKKRLMDGTIDADRAEKWWRERDLTQLQRGFTSLGVPEAIKAYQYGTPEEKASTFGILLRKIENKADKDRRGKEWIRFLKESTKEIKKLVAIGVIRAEDIYDPEENRN